MSEEYRTVTFILQKLNLASVMLTKKKDDPDWKSCPRSLLHGGDDLQLIKIQHALPREVTVRMMAWKADQLHLA